MKKPFTKYNRWGYAIFISNLKADGYPVGIHKADKAHSTCRRYQRDRRLKRTKTGIRLDAQTRAMYGEIADGMMAAYSAWQNGKKFK